MSWKYIVIGIGAVVVVGVGFLVWNLQQPAAPTNEIFENAKAGEEEVKENSTVGQQLRVLSESDIKDAILIAEVKMVGKDSGIAYLGEKDERYQNPFPAVEPVLMVYDRFNSGILDPITNEEILEEYKNANRFPRENPLFAVREIVYNEKRGEFLIVVEIMPYEGGRSGYNADWNIFSYGESDRALRTVGFVSIEKQEMVKGISGSFIPKDFKFSPDGQKVIYTTGIRGGYCIGEIEVGGINLENGQRLRFSGDKDEYFNQLYSENTWGVYPIVADIEWQDNTLLSATYDITLCYGGKDRKEDVIVKTFEYIVE